MHGASLQCARSPRALDQPHTPKNAADILTGLKRGAARTHSKQVHSLAMRSWAAVAGSGTCGTGQQHGFRSATAPAAATRPASSAEDALLREAARSRPDVTGACHVDIWYHHNDTALCSWHRCGCCGHCRHAAAATATATARAVKAEESQPKLPKTCCRRAALPGMWASVP